MTTQTLSQASQRHEAHRDTAMVQVRRIHRRDLNRTWEFLKMVFREVNQETVEYQRPRTKKRFLDTYNQEGVEQLLFEVGKKIVGYVECAFEASGEDNWVNPRYFEKRDMRLLFVDEIAVHPEFQGRGVGSFMLEQLRHMARVRGCTHLVLEVAENNKSALDWYRKRGFYKLDAAIFMAQKLNAEPELLAPRKLNSRRHTHDTTEPQEEQEKRTKRASSSTSKPRANAKRVKKTSKPVDADALDHGDTNGTTAGDTLVLPVES